MNLQDDVPGINPVSPSAEELNKLMTSDQSLFDYIAYMLLLHDLVSNYSAISKSFRDTEQCRELLETLPSSSFPSLQINRERANYVVETRSRFENALQVISPVDAFLSGILSIYQSLLQLRNQNDSSDKDSRVQNLLDTYGFSSKTSQVLIVHHFSDIETARTMRTFLQDHGIHVMPLASTAASQYIPKIFDAAQEASDILVLLSPTFAGWSFVSYIPELLSLKAKNFLVAYFKSDKYPYYIDEWNRLREIIDQSANNIIDGLYEVPFPEQLEHILNIISKKD